MRAVLVEGERHPFVLGGSIDGGRSWASNLTQADLWAWFEPPGPPQQAGRKQAVHLPSDARSDTEEL